MTTLLDMCSVVFFAGAWVFIISGFFWEDNYKCRFIAAGIMFCEAVTETVSTVYIHSAWWIAALWYVGFFIWLTMGIMMRRQDRQRSVDRAKNIGGTDGLKSF